MEQNQINYSSDKIKILFANNDDPATEEEILTFINACIKNKKIVFPRKPSDETEANRIQVLKEMETKLKKEFESLVLTEEIVLTKDILSQLNKEH